MGMGQLGTYFRYLSNNFFPVLYLLDELFCLLLNYRNKLRPWVNLRLYGFLRGLRFSLQLFYERGGIFKVRGMFVDD